MEEAILNQLASLGVIGIGGGLLFKTFLEERKTAIEERQKESEFLKEQIKENQTLYREELKKDRETYIESIEKIASSVNQLNVRIDIIEDDVKEIKKQTSNNNK